MTIRIGNAPCSWGVEFANDPRNPPWRQVLSDCAAAGYTGIELGPIGFIALGAVAEAVGAPRATAATGIAGLAAMAATYRFWRRI